MTGAILAGSVPAAVASTGVNADLELACSTSDGGVLGWDGCGLAQLAISDEPEPGSAPVRALVKFDIDALDLPADAVIESAELHFTHASEEGDRYEIGKTLTARPVLATWTDDVTYDTRNGVTAWSPGDFGTAVGTPDAQSSGVTFDVSATVRDIVRGGADHGFAISGPTANAVDSYLAEGDGGFQEPELTITYSTSCPSDPYGAATTSSKNTVFHWNDVFLNVIRHHENLTPLTLPGPTRTSRAAAMLNIGIYDVFNSAFFAKLEDLSSGSPGAADVCGWEPYLTLADTVPGVDTKLAAGYAAVEILKSIYPLFTAEIEAGLNDDYPGEGTTPTTGTAAYKLGHFVAQKVITARTGDGSGASMSYTPASTTAGAWRLTGTSTSPVSPCTASTDIATPGWGSVTPFAIVSGSAFRPSDPNGYTTYSSLLSSSWYAGQVATVRDYGAYNSTVRTTDETKAAWFWANDLIGTYKPPGQMLQHLKLVVNTQPAAATSGNAGDFFTDWTQQGIRVAHLYAELSIALADSGIAAWDRKFLGSIDLWRPSSAIHEDQDDGNAGTTPDANWKPLSADTNGNWFNPCFPAYASGHATFGGAWSRTLENEFRFAEHANPFPLTLTTEDPHAKTGGVFDTRTFSSFSEAAEENAASRIWLGVHYPVDATAGLAVGRSVADAVSASKLRLNETCSSWSCAETIP